MMTPHLATGIQARLTAWGPSELRQADIEAMVASRDMETADHVATADYATRHLIENLEANERFIIAHGEYSKQLENCSGTILKVHSRGQRN